MKRYSWRAGIVTGLAVAVVAGGAASLATAWYLTSQPSQEAILREQYPLLAKRILIDDPNDAIINFVPLRKQLDARFNALTARNSLYFEYLPDGTSVRIGADDNIIAASLLKVPLAMNLYRAAELGRIRLDDKATLTASEIDDEYGDLWRKGAGYQMSYREAAQHMLRESDNTATKLVYDHTKDLLKPDELALARLDIDQDVDKGQAVVNARSYSSVLKALYMGAYLNRTDSEEVLRYLSQSTETERLTKLLPAGLTVAHKNGVYNAESWAQSDCGIVYVPKRPYVLCIMVELPEDQADALISQVSREVYDFVTAQ